MKTSVAERLHHESRKTNTCRQHPEVLWLRVPRSATHRHQPSAHHPAPLNNGVRSRSPLSTQKSVHYAIPKPSRSPGRSTRKFDGQGWTVSDAVSPTTTFRGVATKLTERRLMKAIKNRQVDVVIVAQADSVGAMVSAVSELMTVARQVPVFLGTDRSPAR